MFDTIRTEIDPIATINTAVDALAREDRDHWPAAVLSERLVQVVETQQRLGVEAARLTGLWDRRQAWSIDGALSGASWLTRKAPIGKVKARRLVATGRMTTDHPVVEDALISGDVTVDHVETLARVAGVKHRHGHLNRDIGVLLDTAAGLPVDEFVSVANLWGKLVDDQATNHSFMEQHQQRGLYLAPTFDGVVMVDGMLDPDAGATVITALDHLAPPDPIHTPEGSRSLAQRRADALVELAETYLSGTDHTAASVTVNTVIDVATLTRTGNHHNDNNRDDDAVLTDLRCDVDRVGPVGRVTMERLGCSAEFTRMLMHGPSVVLDLGRSARFATPAQRKALTVRDRGCVFDGCRRPARWCDIHHLDPWLTGGLTDLKRLVLLCRRHHVLCHEGGWRLQRNPDGTITTMPPSRSQPEAQPP